VRERIGPYRIVKVIAAGGMGLVYKGRDESLGRDVAIKMLRPHDAADAEMCERLRREGRAQASVQHPNIVTVYGLHVDEGEWFIAMEYIEGQTLEELLESRRGGIPLGEAAALFGQVLDALAFAHGRDIVHRDVKPSNVMIRGAEVKLTDFGIALLAGLPRLTKSREVIGSPDYMSPEQMEGKSIDQRSDIYSAALVFYRMVAGRLPFEAREFLPQLHERLNPPDLRAFVPNLPADVCDAVITALQYDPDRRFPSVIALRDTLLDAAVGFVGPQPSLPSGPLVEFKNAPTLPQPLPAGAELPDPPSASGRPALIWAFLAAVLISVASATLSYVMRPSGGPTVQARTIGRDAEPPLKDELPAPSGGKTVSSEPDISEMRKKLEAEQKKRERERQQRELDEKQREKRERLEEIRKLRETIALELRDIRADERMGLYDDAVPKIDALARKAGRFPIELSPELRELAAFRDRIVRARDEVRLRDQESAMWDLQLTAIDRDLAAGKWPEAERFAQGIANDPRAPDDVRDRAQLLLRQAKEGRKAAFGGTAVGETTNTIRKPSSPPRKDF
jgi:serine/threonine-protein kinase